MIKKDVVYLDYNGVKQTETFFFHLSKTVITDHLVSLMADFTELNDLLNGPKKELTLPETIKILDAIKKMVKLSYGERTPDGKRFRQTDEIWDDFRFSPAYDALLTDFMEHPDEGMLFLNAVMPQDLIEQAQDQIPTSDGSQPAVVGTDVHDGSVTEKVFPEEKPSSDPLKGMTREDIEAVLARVKQEQASAG